MKESLWTTSKASETSKESKKNLQANISKNKDFPKPNKIKKLSQLTMDPAKVC